MDDINSIGVYCASSNGRDKIYKKTASRLGHLIALNKKRLVYGGGNIGTMKALADSSYANGGEVIGIITKYLLRREKRNPNISKLVIVDNMHKRKEKIFRLSDVLVAMPGGVGTIDELIEVITWKQLGIHSKPIILLNINNYWNPLIKVLEHVHKTGFAKKQILRTYKIANIISEFLNILRLNKWKK